jgi:uncharacterized protein YdaU (DUF1376 family)
MAKEKRTRKKKKLEPEEKQKLPYIPMYTGDYIKDTRDLSLEAKGAWSDMILFMWVNNSKGILTGTVDDFTRRIGSTSPEQTTRIITEIAFKKVGDVTQDDNGYITITCRRLAREARISEIRTNAVQKRYKSVTNTGTKAASKSVQNTEDEIDIENEFNSDVDSESYGKSENYFHGPVPVDLTNFANALGRSAMKSEQWQRFVAGELRERGYIVQTEVACAYPGEDGDEIEGFIDIRAMKGTDLICIECDNRVTTRDSLVKIHAYERMLLHECSELRYSGMILLRDPKPPNAGKYEFKIPLKSKPLVTSSTDTITREEIEEEIFNDFKLMNSFRKENPKIDVPKLWEKCWKWYSVKPSAPVHAWEWKQKLQTFFNNENTRQALAPTDSKKKDLNVDHLG